MNREQRRAMEKALRKNGMKADAAKAYAQVVYNADAIRMGGAGENTPPQHIEEREKVRLGIERIKAKKNYERMAQGYRDFVEAAGDTVYTAHVERENLISLAEDPRWLFWSGDLVKENKQNESEQDV